MRIRKLSLQAAFWCGRICCAMVLWRGSLKQGFPQFQAAFANPLSTRANMLSGCPSSRSGSLKSKTTANYGLQPKPRIKPQLAFRFFTRQPRIVISCIVNARLLALQRQHRHVRRRFCVHRWGKVHRRIKARARAIQTAITQHNADKRRVGGDLLLQAVHRARFRRRLARQNPARAHLR